MNHDEIKNICFTLLCAVFVILSVFLSGCSGAPVVQIDGGKAINVETQDSVLYVLKNNPGGEKLVTATEDGYVVFIMEQKQLSKPVVISAKSVGEIAILINQYTSDGFTLLGGVSVSANGFGKTTYHASMVR